MYDIARAECEDAISRFFHPVNIVIELTIHKTSDKRKSEIASSKT